MYVIRGEVKREDDPMHDPLMSGRIVKQCLSAETLAETLVRWTKLGRKIASVEQVVWPCSDCGRDRTRGEDRRCPSCARTEIHHPVGERRPKLAAAVLANYPLLGGAVGELD